MPFLKERIDYQLTRYPRLYLAVDRYSPGINWDKRIYLSFIRRGDTVLDVGANVGAHTVFFSHLVRGEGRVFAFEPLADNLVALKETIGHRSRFPNISVFDVAIGNSTNGSAVLRVPGSDSTKASLAVHSAGSWSEGSSLREYSVRVASLDSLEPVRSLAGIDFVKIDVEGGELDVLKGGARILSKLQPLIYCEVFGKWTESFGYAPPALFAFVRSLGYRGARIVTEGHVHAVDLDHSPPTRLFESSSDALFFADRHSVPVADFDRRYRPEAVAARSRQL
jgi:FkbM family methyltransferase